ncbi:GGDEF domain-containing protein [Pseudoneobacillus sp. C159]
MKLGYKGRIYTSLAVLFIHFVYTGFHYFREGYIMGLEIIGFPVLLSFAWVFGKKYDQAKFFSEKDALTEIYNRRFVEAKLPKLIAKTDQKGQQLAFILLDINDFKLINDSYGHNEGDKYLKLIANVLTNSVRKNDIVARWGGDEFLIVLPNLQNINSVHETVSKIQKELKNLSTSVIDIGLSIGTSFYPKDATAFADLLHLADKKMYNIKFRDKKEDGAGTSSYASF